MKKALFLDRDGVVNKEKHYLYKIEEFEFIHGVFETCSFFQNKGFQIVIITNQAGIAKGLYTEKEFNTLTQWMISEFDKQEVIISKVYHCPHHPDFNAPCQCRKPETGMLLKAEVELNLNLSESILIGDKETDIKAGINAGIRQNFLVRSGHSIDETASQANQIINSISDLPEHVKLSSCTDSDLI